MNCQEKLAFKSAAEARANKATLAWRHKDAQLGVYQCKDCELWHFSSRL